MRSFLFMLAWLLILALPATAAETARSSLELNVGGVHIFEPTAPVTRASVTNPDIADIVILAPKELYAYGKALGGTTVILWEEGNGKRLLDISVVLDLLPLKKKLHELYPREEIKVHGSETGIVLSGTVSSPEVMEQVLRLARGFLPKIAEAKEAGSGTGISGGGITNLLKIGGIQQVLLEVKFAEVSRTSQKTFQAGLGLDGLGNDLTGALGTAAVLRPIENVFVHGNFPSAPEGSAIFSGAIDGLIQNPGSLFMNFADNAANIFVNIDNFNAALELLETEGLARILAEPRLVTQSGKEASFLAGGEFPIPVAQELGEISITFKEFGVSLRFTPIVLDDGRISLRVAPSVSQISSASTVPAGIVGANFIVPTFSTRKLDTTVELHDGQTLALAGLLQDELREQVTKIPGLGDIPVLGALFRSSSYQQEKTDLLIAVTPRLARPVPRGTLKFPGDDMRAPGALEFYLEGRLEGKHPRQVAGGSAQLEKSGGLEGEFGSQPIESN